MRTDGVITPTRVELGARCYRRHAVIDVLEKGLAKNPAAVFGNVIHAGAAAHWQGLDVRQALEDEYERYKHELNDKHSLELALSMFDTYITEARLAGPFDNNYQIVTIEQRLPVLLTDNGEQFELTFQLDRLLAQDNQRLLLIDTKSASRLDQNWRGQWDRALQFKLYKRAITKLYDMPVDIIIEGVLKTPKSKIEYYLVPDWDEDTLDEAEWLACQIARRDRHLLDLLTSHGEDVMIEHVLTKTEFNYQDCKSYGAPCPFIKLCDAPPSLRVGILNAEYIDIPAEY